MTRKQAHALNYIALYFEMHKQPPLMREIAAACSRKSAAGAARLVNALEQQGFIRRLRRRKRSIELIDPGEVKLNSEIFRLVSNYAKQEKIGIDTAANELLRQS